MSGAESIPNRAVILTALPVEFQAVRAHLIDPQEETQTIIGTVYERGAFISKMNHKWDVSVVEIEAGNINAASEVVRAIDYFHPAILLFVGVAGGLKDVEIGDVVAATMVYGYEAGKVTANSFETRPTVGTVRYRLIQRAKAEARKNHWVQRIKGPAPEGIPRVIVGPIAAGEKVLAAKNSPNWQLLKNSYGNALAVEMEGYGFLHTAYEHGIEALVIRGISDLIEGKSEADAAHSQEAAARHASAFAFEVLAKLEIAEPQPPTPPSPSVDSTPSDKDKQIQDTTSISKDQLLHDFCTAIKPYLLAVNDLYALFGTRDIYHDQCSSAIKTFNSINEPIQSLYHRRAIIDDADEAVLISMHSQLSELQAEMSTFGSLCLARSANARSADSKEYETRRKKIHMWLEDLVKNLQYFLDTK